MTKRRVIKHSVPAVIDVVAEAMSREPGLMLEGIRLAIEEDRNPAYAWRAIDLCVKSKTVFPDWLVGYLAECAKRMRSDRAKNAHELRDVLPWALGFADLRGNALDTESDYKRTFAWAFAARMEQGDDLREARENACNEVFGQKAADKVDDNTLRRWLREEFGLNKKKPTLVDWKDAIAQYFRAHYLLMQIIEGTNKNPRDSVVTFSGK